MESYVTSDDDDNDDDDNDEGGDFDDPNGSKSDDETSLPTGAVAGNEIHVHDDCVEDSEDDTLKDISGLTTIIAELETDEADRLSPVYSMEYLAILEQTEELEVAVSQELQVIQDLTILEQSQEALVTESEEIQTIEGPAIISQPEEPQVALSEKPQSIEGPAIIEQSMELQVAMSEEPQVVVGPAIVEQPEDPQFTVSEETPVIEGPAIEEPEDPQVAVSQEPQFFEGPQSEELQAMQELTTQVTEGQERYNAGQYVLVAHGQCSLPAVVQEWPFVQFYYPAKNGLWTEGEISHTVLFEDIKKTLLPPDLRLHGSRIYFLFHDL